MNFAEVLSGVRGCAGVSFVAIAESDGIAVETFGRDDQGEELIAEYSTFLRELASANRELQLGELEQVVVTGEAKAVLITSITPGYFIMVVVDRSGNPGKARFASRVAAFRLHQDFV